MRISAFFTLLSLMFLAFNCNNPKNDQIVIHVGELFSTASDKIDQTITVSGLVNHVCSHSGQRCFLVDTTGEFTIRVEASGDIESFARELTGKTISVTGILKEERLKATEIDELEVEYLVKNPNKTNNNGEHCSAEISNINKMREWMKKHGKDYYAIYYIEGLTYESLK